MKIARLRANFSCRSWRVSSLLPLEDDLFGFGSFVFWGRGLRWGSTLVFVSAPDQQNCMEAGLVARQLLGNTRASPEYVQHQLAFLVTLLPHYRYIVDDGAAYDAIHNAVSRIGHHVQPGGFGLYPKTHFEVGDTHSAVMAGLTVKSLSSRGGGSPPGCASSGEHVCSFSLFLIFALRCASIVFSFRQFRCDCLSLCPCPLRCSSFPYSVISIKQTVLLLVPRVRNGNGPVASAQA